MLSHLVSEFRVIVARIKVGHKTVEEATFQAVPVLMATTLENIKNPSSMVKWLNRHSYLITATKC